MKTIAMPAGLGLLIALPVAAQQRFFYPGQRQSPEQQSRDQSECHTWAVRRSSVDPANPPAPTVAAAPAPAREGQVMRGAARGTGLGFVGGAMAGEVARGGRIAAPTGALVGGFRQRDQATAQAERQAAGQQQYEARLAQQHDAYNRALAACMQGRGYSVG